jgi:hypothetical protein
MTQEREGRALRPERQHQETAEELDTFEISRNSLEAKPRLTDTNEPELQPGSATNLVGDEINWSTDGSQGATRDDGRFIPDVGDEVLVARDGTAGESGPLADGRSQLGGDEIFPLMTGEEQIRINANSLDERPRLQDSDSGEAFPKEWTLPAAGETNLVGDEVAWAKEPGINDSPQLGGDELYPLTTDEEQMAINANSMDEHPRLQEPGDIDANSLVAPRRDSQTIYAKDPSDVDSSELGGDELIPYLHDNDTARLGGDEVFALQNTEGIDGSSDDLDA